MLGVQFDTRLLWPQLLTTKKIKNAVCHFLRRRLLSVHGHAVSRVHIVKENQIQRQAGARIHSKLQGLTGFVQEDERGQGEKTETVCTVFVIHEEHYFFSY